MSIQPRCGLIRCASALRIVSALHSYRSYRLVDSLMPSLLCRVCMSTELGSGNADQRVALEFEKTFQHGKFGMHRVRAQRGGSAAPRRGSGSEVTT